MTSRTIASSGLRVCMLVGFKTLDDVVDDDLTNARIHIKRICLENAGDDTLTLFYGRVLYLIWFDRSTNERRVEKVSKYLCHESIMWLGPIFDRQFSRAQVKTTEGTHPNNWRASVWPRRHRVPKRMEYKKQATKCLSLLKDRESC